MEIAMASRTFSPASLIISTLCLAAGVVAHAASPQLVRILPRGAQRGTEAELTFVGQRLEDAKEIFIYQPGVTVTKIEQPTEKAQAGKQLKVTLQIDPTARLGESDMRVRTATGISELKSFWVGAYPTVNEKEPNSDYK